MLKLDLGAGAASPPGFTPMGHAHGSDIFPLPYADGGVDAIRASHVLEHLPRAQIGAVLADWVRALKPGGTLSIAVPDFEKVAKGYLDGAVQPTEAYVMGGQVDANDFHKTLFDRSTLRQIMAEAGLVLLRPWQSDLQDCAALPISLNIEGTKPFVPEMKVVAVMSVPRLGFMDNLFCAMEALPPLNIGIFKYSGAYWHQCIERIMGDRLEADRPDAILTLDYDTIFSKAHVATLIQLMMCHPEADAIAPIQSGRGAELPLFTMPDQHVAGVGVPRKHFEADLAPARTAHFGLTLIRADRLRDLPKPWFHDVPAPDGTWGEGRRDADISFWHRWHENGRSLYIANRVAVGHLELMVRWPGKDLKAMHQPVTDWHRTKATPDEAWK